MKAYYRLGSFTHVLSVLNLEPRTLYLEPDLCLDRIAFLDPLVETGKECHDIFIPGVLGCDRSASTRISAGSPAVENDRRLLIGGQDIFQEMELVWRKIYCFRYVSSLILLLCSQVNEE